MEIWTILLAIYLVSAIIRRWQIQYMYKTTWRGISPDGSDLIIVLFPIFNTIGVVVMALFMLIGNGGVKVIAKRFFKLR